MTWNSFVDRQRSFLDQKFLVPLFKPRNFLPLSSVAFPVVESAGCRSTIAKHISLLKFLLSIAANVNMVHRR